MEVKACPSVKELRRIFNKRPALKAASDLLFQIEEIAEGGWYVDGELNEDEERWMLMPATFWEYAKIVGEDPDDFEDRLKDCIRAFAEILAAKPKEQSQATPDSQSSVDSDEPPPTRA
ncbi:hypothetical protein [Bradyrhizobium diazoefficiens]|uniref:hypothetical protein n=1 Tax=Bradyrhizobium diazoefficiens TaxID=1355477 RepID=UPI003485E3D1